MNTIALILFYLLFPAFAVYLARENAVCKKLGAVVICYICGIVIGNIGVLPANLASIQNPLMLAAISLALPLMFFSIDVRRWSRLARNSLLSFGLQTLAVLMATVLGFLIFRGRVGEETWKLAGMFVGLYTGGTVNLGAIATALRTDSTLYLAAHTSDVVVSAVYLLFLMTVGQRILLKFLPAFRPACTALPEENTDFDSYAGIFEKKTLVPLLGALGLSVLIFITGGLFFLVWHEDIAFVAAILTISTLGIAFSFVPRIRNIKMTYQAGNYFILIFCLVVSSMADFNRLVSTAPIMLVYVTFTILICLLLHVASAKIFRIDADTVIITSVAGICSPPLVPMVASALKNKEIVLSGVMTGIIGWVIGTYLGISLSYILRGIGA
ncbi:MAG TPA: DUF819 family protein [Smithellaceae bacterium]|nr:DUF819 family protein [Smithellaceae bacterium]HRS81927.1 DUF819 family protein [Smithellaceae bacterium]HRV44137.1 DUF819 family protein [Smithellaceae bacterium]